MIVELWTRKKEMGDEDENEMEDPSGPEKSQVKLAWLGLDELEVVLLPTRSRLVPAA